MTGGEMRRTLRTAGEPGDSPQAGYRSGTANRRRNRVVTGPTPQGRRRRRTGRAAIGRHESRSADELSEQRGGIVMDLADPEPEEELPAGDPHDRATRDVVAGTQRG